ncbi:hypothetical protein MA16_Dca024751 [Dendrobium catenatum]|uniref:Uncharacterized protein n=1 Tax=Dendrobium catenatum TaxID=906689 RepID=A0A2I0W5N0_9ASPA|nr:hypothetical protein MA16_Dca024751 [Dendrobium catenatum]
MNAPRPYGSLSLNGRVSNGIVIREGEVPPCRQVHVEGKGKNITVESMAGKKSMGVKRNLGLAILESSASDPNVSNSGLGSYSGAAKFKLSKELRLLGPVEPNYKKKKRDGTLNPKDRERPSAHV